MLARTPAALKKRRYRRRLRDGRIVLRIEACEFELAEAMIAAERLTEAESTQRDALNRAAEGVLREWCERWRTRHRNCPPVDIQAAAFVYAADARLRACLSSNCARRGLEAR